MNLFVQPIASPAVKAENIRRILKLIIEVEKIPQVEFPLKHHFAPGLYGREIFIPKGMIVIGKMHRHSHLNTISRGSVSVMTEDGLIELRGPITFQSPAFVKRSVYTREDTIWTTYHVTNKTDLVDIEEEIICPESEFLDRGRYMQKIEGDIS